MTWQLKALGLAVALALAAPAWAQGKPQPKADFGKREFEANCAACHGRSAQGDGPLVDWLRKPPSDLTQLAKKNGGVFPIARLYEVIAGADLPAHGTRDMPVWGREYRIEAAEYYGELPYDPEAYTRARILALLEYLNRLQAK